MAYANDGKLPVIYVRGFAGGPSGIGTATDDPFYGFNEGSVQVRGAKNAALRKSWIKALSSSQATRNKAVAFIHTRKLPGTFPAVMPNLIPLVNDEVKELNGRMKMTGFTGTLRKSLISSRVIARASTTTSVRKEPWTANEPPVRSGPKFIRTP